MPGELRFRGEVLCPLLPLSALAGRAGDTVAVVGSGPSMRGADPAQLPGFPILLNGAASLNLARAAVAVEDERFVWRHLPMLREALRPDTLRLFSPAVMRALAELAPQLLRSAPVILMENRDKPFGRPRPKPDGAMVATDPQRGVVIAGTVAFSALQMALATGARRIALAGVDLSNAAEPRFYERPGDTAPSGLVTGQERILAHFAAALVLACARGVRLETVTPGSALEQVGVPYVPL